ncbi:hypothetical protein ENBRE01_1123 [Enteropsectra breve]|nr:hypothetical protein ENBRE01_1123 [Enteropsectra breve]
MKIFLIAGFISSVFSRMVLAPLQRPYKDQFAVTLKSDTMAVSFDFRDLLVSEPIERAFDYAKEEGVQISPWLDLLVEFNVVYEQALQDVSCSPLNAYELHEKRLNDELKKSVLFHKFTNENFPEELDDFIKVFPLDIVYDVFQLTSGWCENLSITFTESRAFEILRAFDYLEISGTKKVDLFFNENGEPVRLRLKIIDLFCINFVYLLGKYKLLKKYRSFFNSVEEKDDEPTLKTELHSNSERMEGSAGALIKNIHLFSRIMKAIADSSVETEDKELIEHAKEAEDNKITTTINAIKNIVPLKDYICLLKIIVKRGCVSNLFLASGNYIFSYELLYEENCKVILLTDKSNCLYADSRVDLIEEFKASKMPKSNERLEIVMPFPEPTGYDVVFENTEIPSDFPQCYSCHANFMAIYKDITELYIYNLLDVYKKTPNLKIPGDSVDSYLVKMVKNAAKEFSGLNSLVIDGFYEFPKELFPVLQNLNLKKLGAISFFENIDYYVIHRVLSKDCPLKRSISQFFGRFGALKLLSKYIPVKQITTATIYIGGGGYYRDFTEEENAYSEQIKEFFVDKNLKKSVIINEILEIDACNFIKPKFTINESTLKVARPELGLNNYFIRYEGYDFATEIRSKCKIGQLRAFNDNDSTDGILSCIDSIIRGNLYLTKVEIIVNRSYGLEKIKEQAKLLRSDNSCLILNMDAHLLIDRFTKCSLDKNAAAHIFLIYESYVDNNNNNAIFKIRLRQNKSDKFDYESLWSSFLEYIKKECIRWYKCENHSYLKKKSLEFERVIYEVNNENATEVIRL